MPDITMCRSDKCYQRHECYRYLARPDGWQSFFSGDTVDKDGTCKYFMPIAEEQHAALSATMWQRLKNDNPALVQALESMCQCANVTPASVELSRSDWYSRTTITMEQEDVFKKWLDKKLQKRAFREQLMKCPSLRSKEFRVRFIAEFLLMYGFKRSDWK